MQLLYRHVMAQRAAHEAEQTALREQAASLARQKSELDAAVAEHRAGQSALVEGVVAQLHAVLAEQTTSLTATLERRLNDGVGAVNATLVEGNAAMS